MKYFPSPEWASKPFKSPVVDLTGKICIEILKKYVSYEINYRKSQ